jgi:2-dehydropantoate 2-reductase
MRVLVIGAGAIGGPVSGHLSATDDVLVIDRWPEHVEAINRHGLHLTGARGDQTFRVTARYWDDGVTPAHLLHGFVPDLAFICVKSMATDRACEVLTAVARPDTIVVSLQNGLNEERLSQLLGSERVLGAVTEIGGHVSGPGQIVETRAEGGFVLGELDGSMTDRLSSVAAVLSRCAPTTPSDDILGHLWSKLTWNCMMNPLSAVTGLGQGELIVGDQTRRFALMVGHEGSTVAAAVGVHLRRLEFLGVDLPALVEGRVPDAEAEARLIERYSSQMGKSTSMAQDVTSGRRTEIGALNGYVAAKGAAFGVPTPCNEVMTRLVREVETGRSTPGESVVAQLLAATNIDPAHTGEWGGQGGP